MRCRLKNLIKYKEGYAFYRNKYASKYDNSNYINGLPVINARDFYKGNIKNNYRYDIYIPKKFESSYSKYILYPGDILISTIGTGTAGKVARFTARNNKCLLNQHIIDIETKNDNILNKSYLYWNLRSQRFHQYIANANKGSAQPFVTLESVFDYSIKLPNILEQEKESNCLDVLDRKIQSNISLRQQLLKLANLYFLKRFQKCYQGIDKLKNYINIYDKNRKHLTKKERLENPGKYRYIGPRKIVNHINNYNFNGTYILMGASGTVYDSNYHPVVQYIYGKFWPNEDVHVLTGQYISNEWLYLFLRNINIRPFVTGAVQQHINQANLKSIPITVPSRKELIKFQYVINPIFLQMKKLTKQNITINRLKRDLSFKFFN